MFDDLIMKPTHPPRVRQTKNCLSLSQLPNMSVQLSSVTLIIYAAHDLGMGRASVPWAGGSS